MVINEQPSQLPPRCPNCGAPIQSVQTSEKGLIGTYRCDAKLLEGIPPKPIKACSKQVARK